MRIKGIDFPETLLEAQRQGTLVVFAGAGVSMGPPSNLPDFKQLAIRVSGEALTLEEDEPIDLFLGRLANQGIDVHSRTRDIIGDPASKPTILHYEIVSLVRHQDTVRIVTTNFDRHFTTVATETLKDSLEIYCAPALPLGREIAGIVYLHGSVAKNPKHLVLTDSDFGRAYLTDGWATRFLVELFGNYIVLFIGYSHDDPDMRYLARGLTPHAMKPRYALSLEGQEEHWKFLGITPITYPSRDGPYEHSALIEAIAEWSKRAKMGALDRERRIKEIVESRPPIDPEVDEEIENAIRDLVSIRFFTRYARTPEWLRWAESKHAFHNLFQTDVEINALSQEIALWFVNHFVCEYPDESLALVERQKQTINSFLWELIASKLAHREPRPDHQTLSKWIPTLLSTAQSQCRIDSLEYVLHDCQTSQDRDIAILLFNYLTKPRARLRPHFGFGESKGTEKVDVEITVTGSITWLNKSWQDIFHPNIADLAGQLDPILTTHLTEAHLLLRAFGKADDRWDPISYSRSAIEQHEQNRHTGELNVLIDAARDTLEWMLQNTPSRGQALIEEWSCRDVPLLKRLAIHGTCENSQINSDQKISWILDKGWLYAFPLRHEVFRLLAKSYSTATEATRTHLIEQVNQGPLGRDAEKLEKETREYVIYNLLVWLRQAEPNDPLITQSLNAMQESRPEWEPREHPDFDHWMSVGWGRGRSLCPFTAEQLIGKGLQETLEWFRSNQQREIEYRACLETVTAAVSQSYEWSEQLASLLRHEGEWNSDLWRSVLEGWQSCQLSESQWRELIRFLIEHPQLYTFDYQVSNILKRGINKEQTGIPLTCLPLAEELADQVWSACCEKPEEEEIESRDWLSKAINHPGGMIVEFWFNVLSKKRVQAGNSWNGLPTEYREHFGRVIANESYTAQMGRVLLASQTQYLFSLDPDWTHANIPLLFDWTRNSRRAQQAWHGFLAWGQINQELLPDFLPLYAQCFSKLSIELSNFREHFCEHLASIAVFGSGNPVADGWLWKFLKETDDDSRTSWTTGIASQLASLDKEAIEDLWELWLENYWSQRLTGVPVPLSEGEKEAMVSWSILLEPVFPAVTNKICAISPAPRMKIAIFYHELAEKEFGSKYPDEVTHLLAHLLSNAYEPFYQCDAVDKLVRSLALYANATSHAELLQICDRLAELGCQTASELRQLVENVR